MYGDRSISMLSDADQWVRCSHHHTILDPEGGIQLDWEEPRPTDDRRRAAAAIGTAAGDPGRSPPVGIAFDRWCRLYRSVPGRGRIDVFLPGETSPSCDTDDPRRGRWRFPVALSVDANQLLHVAEAGSGQVAVIDLRRDRLLRRVSVRSPDHPGRRPADVAEQGRRTWVLLQRPAGIVSLIGRQGPFPGPPLKPPLCRSPLDPGRLVVLPDQGLLVLWRRQRGSEHHAYLARTHGAIELEIDGATDAAVTASGTLVVARRPGEAFRRFRRETDGWLELEPIAAPAYDGGGIGVAPDGSVAYSTRRGVGWAGGAAIRYHASGWIVTYRLDSGSYRTRWGRMFLDACLPRGTILRASFLSSDEDEVDDPLQWSPPARRRVKLRQPDLSPPLPSVAAMEEARHTIARLHRRPNGREWPWAQVPAEDRFETYEAPVRAPPGRYLWVVLELTGTPTRSPRVRELRIEHPGHRLLAHLPRSWSRQEEDADFLHRFLSPAEGLLHELDERAATLAVLLDPTATPQEALAWLASFLGIVLDRRWPMAARRTLVAEAYTLFRRRGTLAALQRVIEIYLGYPVTILEHWRLRGLGGVLLGGRGDRAPAAPQRGDPAIPILGGTTRAGGTLGGVVLGGTGPSEDGFRTNAHRFTVLVPADLSEEQRNVLVHILDLHRPAHTMFELCELGFGMRVGRRLHVQLTSIVGAGAAWAPTIVGQVAIGGDGILGTPAVGARLAEDSVAGELRVG